MSDAKRIMFFGPDLINHPPNVPCSDTDTPTSVIV